MVIISVIHYTLMSNPHVKSSANPPLPQYVCCLVSPFQQNVAEDQTVAMGNLKKKENKSLFNVFMYSVKIQRKWQIDWVDKAVAASYTLYATKALQNHSFCYSILDKRSPNPLLLCSEQAHTHAFRHCIPLSHTHVHCTLPKFTLRSRQHRV